MTKDLITLANISIDNPPLVDFPEGVKWSDFPENKRKLIIEYLITTQKSNKNFKNYSHIPCKFFKKGKCQAGRSCPFSHNLDFDQACNIPCEFFLKGECKFGKNCLNLHEYPKADQSIINQSNYSIDSMQLTYNTNGSNLSSTVAQFSTTTQDPFINTPFTSPNGSGSLSTTVLPSIPHYTNAPTLFNADPITTTGDSNIYYTSFESNVHDNNNSSSSLWGNTNNGPVVGGNNTHGKKTNYYNNNYYDFNEPITRPLYTTPTSISETDSYLNSEINRNSTFIKPEDVKFFLNKNSQN